MVLIEGDCFFLSSFVLFHWSIGFIGVEDAEVNWIFHIGNMISDEFSWSWILLWSWIVLWSWIGIGVGRFFKSFLLFDVSWIILSFLIILSDVIMIASVVEIVLELELLDESSFVGEDLRSFVGWWFN